MADDAPAVSADNVSFEAPSNTEESDPSSNTKVNPLDGAEETKPHYIEVGDVTPNQAVDEAPIITAGAAVSAETGAGEESQTPADQDKTPITENAVADAIAAATPRGEKQSAPELKTEEPAPKEAESVEQEAETKKVIKEEKTAPLEELAPSFDQKLSLKVDKAPSQPSSPSAGDSILPTSPQIRAITGNDSALPVKEYLNSTIVPILRDALRALVKTRPDDPYEFVAKYLVEHKPSK